MFRRAASSAHLKALTLAALRRGGGDGAAVAEPAPIAAAVFRWNHRLFSSDSAGSPAKKRVEDVMPIATGLEREELEAELEGKKRFDMDPPSGPFGTKANPAVIESWYDKRIVGCPGGEGEDEHDVIWFWLEKDKPYECPICSQYFMLKVVGSGGDPEAGHDHHDDHHHH